MQFKNLFDIIIIIIIIITIIIIKVSFNLYKLSFFQFLTS